MIREIKNQFPVYSKNPNLVFLDTAASALKPESVIKTINDCYSYEYSNVHRGLYSLSANLTKLIKFPRLVEINKAQKIIPKNNVNTNVNLKFNNDLNIFI